MYEDWRHHPDWAGRRLRESTRAIRRTENGYTVSDGARQGALSRQLLRRRRLGEPVLAVLRGEGRPEGGLLVRRQAILSIRFLFAVHNKYLLVLAETGFVGLLAYLAFLLSTVRKGWQCWRFCDEPLSLVALGLTVGIVGHMVHMTVDVFRGRPTQQLVWLIAGLLTAMYQMRPASSPSDSRPLIS